MSSPTTERLYGFLQPVNSRLAIAIPHPTAREHYAVDADTGLLPMWEYDPYRLPKPLRREKVAIGLANTVNGSLLNSVDRCHANSVGAMLYRFKRPEGDGLTAGFVWADESMDSVRVAFRKMDEARSEPVARSLSQAAMKKLMTYSLLAKCGGDRMEEDRMMMSYFYEAPETVPPLPDIAHQ